MTMQRAQLWLGTLVEIAASGSSQSGLSAAINRAFARVASIHTAMGFHDAASELSQINRSAARDWVPLSDDMARVLAAVCEFAAASNGVFDPSIAPWLVASGQLPHHDGCANHANPDWRAIDLDGDRVRFTQPLLLDLGGIAKGYAVDAALAVLHDAGLTSARVNAGGDLARFGGVAAPVRVRHPLYPTQMLQLADLQTGAVATSAGYYQNGASPLRHPRSGAELCRHDSISVFAPDCMTADALTKIVAAEPACAPALLVRYQAQALRLAVENDTLALTICDGSGWREIFNEVTA
ncbi:MAG: putative thiamine biosynthesis lipoprotein apbE precursor transrane [Proteobacteria bacterium]|jgi:thiamine biosynthesis lipoprotein|nr:putative thiamine biosynthesis lipoprotein apbE precursor transrane [Pseudomonadota bacterium]